MKFQQLKIGQKFEYQGDIYVKHSPLVAIHSETGEHKLIPRYAAIVVTVSDLPAKDKAVSREINSDQIQTAFDRFYTDVLEELAKAGSDIDAHTLESIKNRLENSRQNFFNELGL